MHVVVTGGSSGIGLEVAKIYAGRGASVSLIARNTGRLEEAKKVVEAASAGRGRVLVASADTADAEQIRAALDICETGGGPCDILVASAGIVEPGFFHEQSSDAFDAQWQTNVSGTINAVRHVYAGMRARGEGRIMIVSSAAAFIGIPAYSAYCTSKAALVGFADALRLEAIGSGVAVGICFPPDTDTPQLANELKLRPRAADILMGRIRARPAAEIAREIVTGIDRRRSTVYFTPSIAALALFGRLARPLIEAWYKLRIGR